MDYKSHIYFFVGLFALLVFVLFYYGYPLTLTEIFLSLCLGVVMSIFPDIDHRSSKIRDIVMKLSLGLAIFLLLLVIAGKGIMYLVVVVVILIFLLSLRFVKHRGIYHSFGVAVFVSVLFGMYLYYVFGVSWLMLVSFFLGWVSHIFLDNV